MLTLDFVLTLLFLEGVDVFLDPEPFGAGDFDTRAGLLDRERDRERGVVLPDFWTIFAPFLKIVIMSFSRQSRICSWGC